MSSRGWRVCRIWANLPRVAALAALAALPLVSSSCFLDGHPLVHSAVLHLCCSTSLLNVRARPVCIVRPPWHLALPRSVKLGEVSLTGASRVSFCCGRPIDSKPTRLSPAFSSPQVPLCGSYIPVVAKHPLSNNHRRFCLSAQHLVKTGTAH